MTKYDPPAPDSFWMKDLINVLDDENLSAADKLQIIYEMMPDNFGTENI